MIIFVLPALAYLTGIVQAVASNSTCPSCPQPACDGTTRSVWSILGSCALTLLICVWHAIHLNVYSSQAEWLSNLVLLILAAFFAPEFVVMVASQEFWVARDKVNKFRGYEWSMTHSFFAEMGGFAYRDDEGEPRTIKSLEFLELCEADKIANPVITVQEIKDKSKSDALGKAILVSQLLWFMLQVVVRGSRGLAVTLVELDTVSMAALALLVLWLWWEKPYRPQCPHIFYYSPPRTELYPQTQSVFRADMSYVVKCRKNAWKAEPSHLYSLMSRFFCIRKPRATTSEEGTALIDEDEIMGISCLATWTILGALHLIAWNFDFPTETEKILWRVASIVLTVTPFVFVPVFGAMEDCLKSTQDYLAPILVILGIISRMLLVGLMLASLRSLPPSAYQTIPWTAYIPHL
ncbi:hypothetical protein V8E55_007933 [Tylopilus felleus]